MSPKNIENKLQELFDSSSFYELSDLIVFICNKSNKDIQYFLPLFRKILKNCNDIFVLSSIIDGVLCLHGIKDDIFINKAFEIIKNDFSDSFLKEYAISGLGNVYASTKNKEVLQLLTNVLNNNNENLDSFALHSCLRVIGLTSLEISNRISDAQSKGKKNYLEKNMIVFEKEFKEIYKIIK